MRRKKIIWEWVSAVLLVLAVFTAPALAGDLNPSAPPGTTMRPLNELSQPWDQVLPASERFKLVMGGAAVLDKETGLVWEQSPSTESYIWGVDLSGDINAAYQCNEKYVGGRVGWRLPTLQELASLVDRSDPDPDSLKLPSGHPFSNVQTALYWTATTDAKDTRYAYLVSFQAGGFGGSSYKDEGRSYVWCVRGGQGPDVQ